MSTEVTSGGIPLYPQTKLRINATYSAGEGQALPAGQPETVEIEINDPLPDDLLPFVSGLVAALFGRTPAGATAEVTHNATEVQS